MSRMPIDELHRWLLQAFCFSLYRVHIPEFLASKLAITPLLLLPLRIFTLIAFQEVKDVVPI